MLISGYRVSKRAFTCHMNVAALPEQRMGQGRSASFTPWSKIPVVFCVRACSEAVDPKINMTLFFYGHFCLMFFEHFASVS